jgi:hypothetical protein
MSALAVRPIDAWPGPRTPSGARQHSNFKAPYHATLGLLERELRMLDARYPVLMIDVRDADIRLDGFLRADARPADPGVIIAFDSSHGPLKYACDLYWDWHDNVRAIALGLEALRRVERYGIASRGEQYTGWKQLSSGTAMGAPMNPEEAARVLLDLAGWTDVSPREVVDDASSGGATPDVLYREAARLHHPDRGGDPDLMARATEARDVIVGRYD